MVDQDDRDAACKEIKEKHLGLRWTPGHPALEDVHSCREYLDIKGNTEVDAMAGLGDELPKTHTTTSK